MSDRINYRQVLKTNENKTKVVVFLFLILYCMVGFIIDIFLQWPKLSSKFPEFRGLNGLFNAIASFEITPFATAIMVVIGMVSVLVTFMRHDKMILWGSDYIEINPDNGGLSLEEKQLYNVVEELKISGGLKYMPKVYMIEADYMNAFASGYSEKSAMVAITRGLMEKLNRSELQAVMAHEVSHIKHMDIKLTLFVGVLANIILIVLDMLVDITRFSSHGKDNNANNARLVVMLIVLAMRLIFPMLTTLLRLSLSRSREYMADAGAVKLTRDREAMATALLKIHEDYNNYDYEDKGASVRQAAYIYNPIKSMFGDAMSTHPSLENRIKALGMRKMLRNKEE